MTVAEFINTLVGLQEKFVTADFVNHLTNIRSDLSENDIKFINAIN